MPALAKLPPMLRPVPLLWMLLAVAAVLAGCAGASSSGAPPAEPAIDLKPCQLSTPGSAVRLAAQCGTLTVPEDRTGGAGRTLDLNIAVLKAISRSPAPDPLFFLTGGPGQAATESYPQLSGAFDRIRDKRDIVLVDQRGTGRSHPLDCPELEGENVAAAGGDAYLAPALQSCLGRLDADPRLYTTPIAMEDLDQVREALGYDQINLYGVSYGTRAAQVYLRQHPDRVRTVILDGVWPIDLPLGSSAAPSAQRALDLISDRCSADPACRDAFPDWRSEFMALLASLREQPARLVVPDPVSAEPAEIVLTAPMVAGSIRLLSYSPETAALLPLLIHTASSTGDPRLLAAQALMVTTQLVDSLSLGMNYSVICSEDVPFFTPEEAARSGAGTYLGDTVAEGLMEACAVWPRGEVPRDFDEPVASQVPVLLLSGEVDPVTPPSNGEQVARALPRSLHLVVPGQGHNVVFRGCVPRIATTFIESGTVEGLDTRCTQETEPMPFFLKFAGPQP